MYENGKVDRIRQGIDRGAGLRIIKSGATLYAYSTEVTPAAMDELVCILLEADPARLESTGLIFRAVRSDQQSVVEVDPAECGSEHQDGSPGRSRRSRQIFRP